MAKDKERSGKQHSQTIVPSEPQLTADEIRSQGESAARLLDSPIYNLAHRSVVQNLQDEWMSTSPHEREKREGLYQRIQALSAISSDMAMMVEQVRTMNESELANERKLQLAYDENAGFPGHEQGAA